MITSADTKKAGLCPGSRLWREVISSEEAGWKTAYNQNWKAPALDLAKGFSQCQTQTTNAWLHPYRPQGLPQCVCLDLVKELVRTELTKTRLISYVSAIFSKKFLVGNAFLLKFRAQVVSKIKNIHHTPPLWVSLNAKGFG